MNQLDDLQKVKLFPGFEHGAEVLSAFHLSIDSFVMSLKSGEIVRFVPEDTAAFLQWLLDNRVKDIR